MKNILFLQSEVQDPYAFYARMIENHPVYYDQQYNMYAVYSYDACSLILNSNAVAIPNHKNFTNECEEVKVIVNNLARLTNDSMHPLPRRVASDLMTRCNDVNPEKLMKRLINYSSGTIKLDWVADISRLLPVHALLKGFGFTDEEIDLIVDQMDDLLLVMLPTRSAQQIISVNKAVHAILPCINARVSAMSLAITKEVQLYSANLVGLIIQSYDVCRGLLSNALLQLVRDNACIISKEYCRSMVKETLRFDPPIHNTRRVVSESLEVLGHKLGKGEHVLLVLASANRDTRHFTDPHRFDPNRTETSGYLSYGAGAHRCIAEHFSVELACSALYYLFSQYYVDLQEKKISYEPKINARLPRCISLLLSEK